ncbi:DUF6303 family protein [Streptomyces sp. NPDC003023]|uniref:DUF6303 family protein n=1 Tax=Streptomyces sp. NPDC003023 TaxID=3364675 RepID=UPI0036786310
MAAAFTAQVSRSTVTDRWRLYVVLLGVPASQWPEYDLNRGPEVPSVQERSRALNALGYVFTDDAEWQWAETLPVPDEPDAPVRLFATTKVREATE